MGALIGPILQMVGGIAGHMAGSNSWGDSVAAQKKALTSIADINTPTDLVNMLQLQQYQSAGQMDPALMQVIQQLSSQAKNVQEDPSLRANQMNALQQLSQLSQTGANAQDRMNYNQAQTQANADNTARQNSILASMRAQGMGNSGAALAARLQGAQASANSMNQAAQAQAASASQRALQALSQYGTMSGDVRNQDNSIAMNKAAAADQMNRFNVQNQMSADQYNVNARNQAQQYNLQNKQSVMDQNTSAGNQELKDQKMREQQLFQDQLNLGKTKNDAYSKASDYYNKKGDAEAKEVSGMFGGAGESAGGMSSLGGGMGGGMF